MLGQQRLSIKNYFFTIVASATLLFAGAGPAHAVATTLVVDDDGMATAADCDDTAMAYVAIQAAVDAASAGDVVLVCPGTYNESVTIDKQLTMMGAQSGTDARSGRTDASAESTVTQVGGNPAFFLTDAVDGVVVDGFRFATNQGVWFQNGSGHRIVNNIFQDTDTGVFYATTADQQNVIEHNRFSGNTSNANSDGIQAGGDQGGNTLVNENLFENNQSAAYVVSSTGPSADIVISNNTIRDNSIALFSTVGAEVTDNTITATLGSAIFIGGGNSGTVVRGNSVSGDPNSAIRITDSFAIGVNSNITITNNVLVGNGFGINIAANSFAGAVTATRNVISGNDKGFQNDSDIVVDGSRNWWGRSTGPSDWSTGAGDSVSASVAFFPWATNYARSHYQACTITAKAGKTTKGTSGPDIICGTAGNDLIYGGKGADLILGNGGNDTLKGQQGGDRIIGGPDDDDLFGSKGFDWVQGWTGSDTCSLGAGGGRTASCE
jgi:hypothetical protein